MQSTHDNQDFYLIDFTHSILKTFYILRGGMHKIISLNLAPTTIDLYF